MVLYKQSRGHHVSAFGLSLLASLDSSLSSALGLILMVLMFFPRVFKMYYLSKIVLYLIVLQINNAYLPKQLTTYNKTKLLYQQKYNSI